mgnify:FL=1
MQVVYHLGAHATDAERLLRCLLKNRTGLADAGILVPPPGRYRMLLRETVAKLKGAPATRHMQGMMLETVTDGDSAARIVFSSDDFLGIAHRVIGEAGFYSMAARRVAALANLFPEAEAEFHIAICNPASLVPHLIGEIRGATYATVMGDTDPMSLRWLPVIRAMRDALPEARLVVWCHEDAPLIWPEALRAVAGLPDAGVMEGDDDLLRTIMRPEGHKRLTEYFARYPPKGVPQRRRVVTAFLEKFALDDAIDVEVALPGWTEALTGRIPETYEAVAAAVAQVTLAEMIAP